MKKQLNRTALLIFGMAAATVLLQPQRSTAAGDGVFDLPEPPRKVVELKTARLSISTEPAGARVRNLSIVPPHRNGMPLAPGTYRIEVSATSYQTLEKYVELKRGDNLEVKMVLVPQQKVVEKKKVIPSPPPPPSATTFTDPTTGMEFVFVEGGCYQMGDTFGEGDADEKPGDEEVCVDDFYMGKYEVTQGEWQKIMDSNPSEFQEGDRYPVETVSWNTITKDFLPKLNRRSGKNYRLPTEAEWEYAARERGKKVRFGNGKNIADPEEINFDGSSDYKKFYSRVGVYRGKTTRVGSFAAHANALGLYDMSGNVWEWCQDTWHDSYKGGPTDGSAWETGDGSYRVIRGGSWSNFPGYVRAANRSIGRPDSDNSFLGFRLVFSVH